MKQIYNGALRLITKRIESCGRALQCETDAYSISYWNMELAKASHLKMRIERRLKIDHNVIYIDFKSKRKAA